MIKYYSIEWIATTEGSKSMPHSITLKINPESLNFLNQCKKKRLSPAQKSFMEVVKNTDKSLSNLRAQNSFEFTKKNDGEISRGGFYAITDSLQKKFPQEKISLENLQAALENDLHVNNKETISFITLCLVEPVWLPGSLPAIACSILSPTSYLCTNQNPSGSLKAVGDNNQIAFHLNLDIKTSDDEKSLHRGTATICFTIDNTTVKFLPIRMELNFPNKEESEQFKHALSKEFKDWIFWDKRSHWPTTDLWVIPVLLGCLLGLIAMISLVALSLTPISPLLLPPLGLALGLSLSSIMHSYAHISIKKEQTKSQRPIHISNKPMQTTAFFNHPDKITGMPSMHLDCRTHSCSQ